MANIVIGKVERIGNIIYIPTKNGGQLEKRELVLNCTRFDIYTGARRENYPLLEFVGKRCLELDTIKVGDVVQVSFILQGNRYEDKNTHEQKYITRAIGYKVDLNKKDTVSIAPTFVEETHRQNNSIREEGDVHNSPFNNFQDLPF